MSKEVKLPLTSKTIDSIFKIFFIGLFISLSGVCIFAISIIKDIPSVILLIFLCSCLVCILLDLLGVTKKLPKFVLKSNNIAPQREASP